MPNLPPITSAFLNVTNACNLACRYCFVEQHPNYMTFDVAKDAAIFLADNCDSMQSPSITFFGGEPMLCWDSVVYPLIEYIREKYGGRYSLSMTTNGTLLTKEIIKYLAKHNVSVMVSIDGNRETQDYNRPKHNGGSSFNDLEKIMGTYIEYYPNSTFRSTVIPDTSKNVFDNISFAQSVGYKNYFLIPNVFEVWDENSKNTLKEEMRKISNKYIDDCNNGREPMVFSTLNDSFQAIVKINNMISAGCKNCISSKEKCGLGQGPFASIDWKGRLFACQEMVSCKGEGDIFYIGDIYHGADEERRLELGKLFSADKIFGDNCADCILQNVCDAGCAANNYMACGDVNKVPSIFCWWKRLLLQEAIYIMNILGDEHCQGHKKFREIWMGLQGKKGVRCLNNMN